MVNISLNRYRFPTKEDFDGAVAALRRLQDTYKITPSKIAKGKLGSHNGLPMSSKLQYMYLLQFCYRIAGIFRGGKYSFLAIKSSFHAFYFCFCFISAILHYSQPHPFCEISFFGLILERKKRKLNPTKITRYELLHKHIIQCKFNVFI